jgi:hypothetical protein
LYVNLSTFRSCPETDGLAKAKDRKVLRLFRGGQEDKHSINTERVHPRQQGPKQQGLFFCRADKISQHLLQQSYRSAQSRQTSAAIRSLEDPQTLPSSATDSGTETSYNKPAESIGKDRGRNTEQDGVPRTEHAVHKEPRLERSVYPAASLHDHSSQSINA